MSAALSQFVKPVYFPQIKTKKPNSAGARKTVPKPANRPASAPSKETQKMDIFAKEEEYKWV